MPISVPPYAPIRGAPRPQLDAGLISGLGDALQEGLEYGQKRKSDRATREALQQGAVMRPDGTMDYSAAAANILQRGGDIDTAATFMRLAEVQERTNWERNQPDWQVINGSLYNLRDLGGQGGGRGAGGQPSYSPGGGGQPEPDLGGGYPPEPEQQADAGQPEPVIRGPEPQRPRRRGLNPAGQEVDQEWTGSEWTDVSGPKKVERQQKPPTIDAQRNKQLLSVVTPELATIETTFAELSKPENQVGAMAPGGLGNYATSAGYQQGRNALRTIIASYLYSMSGATANPGEVETQTDVLMPRIGEADTSVADKLKRIRVMVDSIKVRAGADAAAEGEVPPDEQIAGPPDEPQGEIVESGGVRYMLMPDGTVVQLD